MYNADYYEQLEQGARYLASIEADDADRQVHLTWANRYSRLASDARVPNHAILVRVAAHCS